jgi:hypothetical protein
VTSVSVWPSGKQQKRTKGLPNNFHTTHHVRRTNAVASSSSHRIQKQKQQLLPLPKKKATAYTYLATRDAGL